MAKRPSIEQRIEQLKELATVGLAESEQLLGRDRQHRWSIPDRKIAIKYLIDVTQRGMTQQQWAALHPEWWKRLVEVAPLRKLPPPIR
jgi:hypothetical protein